MATTLNLTIDQGATFSQAVSVGVSYNGYTVRAMLRDKLGPSGRLLATFACTDVAAGVSTVSLTATETAALLSPASARTDEREAAIGYWDLEVVSGATVVRTHQGIVRLSREVTR